jgi:hypothetical protein
MGTRWVQLKLRHGMTTGHACRISLSDATEKLIIMEVVSSVGAWGPVWVRSAFSHKYWYFINIPELYQYMYTNRMCVIMLD